MTTTTQDFSGWKYYQIKGENAGIAITHQDGRYESRLLIDPEVTKWLEEGNQALPAEEQQ